MFSSTTQISIPTDCLNSRTGTISETTPLSAPPFFKKVHHE